MKEVRELSDSELKSLLETDEFDAELCVLADKVRRETYGDAVYVRGLIEFSNYCKNDCLYCGIRCHNLNVQRYRLTKEEILTCCEEGYALGYRTFVLQSGEDLSYKARDICEIVYEIKTAYSDCAVTLSIGEKSRQEYQDYFDAGADRYLLRHETASTDHYGMLHPASMSLESRIRCLFDLKEIGYQVGAGFMVGSPYQTTDHLIHDLRFLQNLQPDMIGIGPYLTHNETPFADKPNGSLALTLRLISVLRLMFPYALIPATTALGTIAPNGREQGLKAGANVVMPNLSPVSVRKLYSLYENKICTGEESAQCRGCLEQRVRAAGYRIVTDIGNARRQVPEDRR
ncbi:MAG: [FeFe] hydrogenase H-cluster radical SAM maturase HydE [Blautia sp.]|nr:[FeFe] hydrogenase H-cluster radical SAM maturase HydE [Blautia sp.]